MTDTLGDNAHVRPLSPPRDAARRFGEEAHQFFTLTLDLATERGEEEVKITGTILWAISASDLDASATVKFNTQAGEGVVFQRGLSIRGMRYDRLFITNAAQAGKTITLFYGREHTEGIQIDNALIGFQNIKIDQPDTITSITDIALVGLATTQILAAKPTRREAIITNLAANVQTMRIGDSNAGATRGIPLAPGDTLILTTTAAIHGFKPVAGNENVAAIEIED